jgi:phosphate butyryltransferase
MITRSEDLIKHVKRTGRKCRLVVAAADDADSIETIRDAWSAGVIDPILVGPQERIAAIARTVSVDLAAFKIVNCATEGEAITTSVHLIRDGEGDIIMKGNLRTADLMKELLRTENHLRTDRILSHVGVFSIPGERRIMLITDAGINIAPDFNRKKDIILNAVDVAHALGLECPRVAVLSFIEKIGNEAMHPAIRASTEDAIKLTALCREGHIKDCIIEGPYALDNAVSLDAAEKKRISGEVAGRADILVAHDINMGNAIYKALQVWVHVVMAGVVVGCKVPVVVPSRNDTKASKLQSIASAMSLMLHTGKNETD